jgi:hypothetical protein
MVHGLPWTDGCRLLSGDRGERDLLADDVTSLILVNMARAFAPQVTFEPSIGDDVQLGLPFLFEGRAEN